MNAGVSGLFTHKQNSSVRMRTVFFLLGPFLADAGQCLGSSNNSENQSAGSGVSLKSSVCVIPTQQRMHLALYFIPPGLSGCVNAISRWFGFSFLIPVVAEGFGGGFEL